MANIKISELNELTQKAYDDYLPIVDSSASETKKISVKDLTSSNVELLAVSDTAPSECSEGDKYYNTETGLIYTATATDTWGTVGEEPIKDILYVVFSEKNTYAWNGTDMLSVGGGSGSEIVIGDESEATEDTKLLVDTSGSIDELKYKDETTGTFKDLEVKALDSLPVGTSVEYAGTTIPDELKGTWLFERGQELSRTEYAKLFSVIGTSYGVGDGSTTFNLPNKCGRVPVGLDENDTDFNTIGKTGGSKYLQEHSHSFRYNNGGATGANGCLTTTSNVSSYETFNTNAAGTGDSGNLQPYIVKNYIIKVKETRPLASHTVNAYSESESNAYSCDYSNKAFGGKILWTNPSPTSEFASQNITLSSDDYDMYEVIYSNYKGEDYYMTSGKTPKGHGKRIMMNIGSSTNGPYAFKRDITYNNPTSLSITLCSVWYGSIETSSDVDLIPLYVIGYKTGLFPTQQSTRSSNTYSGDIEEKKDIVIDDGGEEKPIDEDNDKNNK